MIRTGGDRYCKNPYFLHSVCTSNGPTRAFTELGSIKSQGQLVHTYYGPVNVKRGGNTGSKVKSKKAFGSKNSEGRYISRQDY